MEANTSIYANFVHHYKLSLAERAILALALAPHIRPQLLDVFVPAHFDPGMSALRRRHCCDPKPRPLQQRGTSTRIRAE